MDRVPLTRFPRARIVAAMGGSYLATAAFWLSYVRFGFNPWDECVLAYGGVRLQQGQMVLVDFFGYFPGRYLFALLCFTLGGTNLLALRVGICLLTAVMPLAAYLMARRIMPAGWALLPASMILLAPSTYYFRFYPLVLILGGWSLCRLMEVPSRNRQLQHGVLLAGCFLLKSAPAGFVLLLTPLALWLSAGPWIASFRDWLRAMAWVGMAVVVTLSPLLIYYTYRGVLSEALSSVVFRYVLGSSSMWVPYPSPFPSMWRGDFHGAVSRSFFWMTAAGLLGTVLTVGAALMRGNTKFASGGASQSAEEQLVVLSVLGSMGFLLPIYRAGFFNVLRASSIPWILIGFLLSRQFSGGVERGGRRSAGRLLARRVGQLVALPALVYPVLLGAHLLTSANYRNLSTGSVAAALNGDLVALSSSRARVLVEPRHRKLIDTVVGWIRRDTRVADSIFAAPLSPLFYFFGRRDNPTGDDHILPGYWGGSRSMGETLERLQARPPKLFIYVDVALDGRKGRRFKVYSRPIYEEFVTKYAVTDRTWYPLGPRTLVPVSNFRRLRMRLHWPAGMGEAGANTQVRLGRGPGERRALEVNGTWVTRWSLSAGAALELEGLARGDRFLVFRFHATGGSQAWSRPNLEVTMRDGADWSQRRVFRADPADDGQVPAMTALRLPSRDGRRLTIEMSARATRPEQLAGKAILIQPAILREASLFYSPDEPIDGP